MTRARWTAHALESLRERAIDRGEADEALENPTRTITGHGRRTLFLRRYHDLMLDQQMVLCLVTEPRDDELLVITVFKTSKIEKYLGGAES